MSASLFENYAREWRRRAASPWGIGLLLVAATVAVYWPVVGFDFFNYDDPGYFSENHHVLGGLTWKNFLWAFHATDISSWYPLMWLSFMLDVTLFGKGPAGPHAVNLVLHLANTVLVFALLHRLTGSRWRSAAVAAVFALHPLHVESVAWIAERKDVLSTFFGLLALGSYARYAENKSRKQKAESRNYLLALGFFVLGLLSKPMLVTLPGVMLLFDCWPLHRFQLSTINRQLSTIRSLLWEKIPFFLLGGAVGLVTLLVHEESGAITPLAEYSIGLRIQNAFVAYARYLGKTFWPVRLAVPYPHPGQWPLWLVSLGIILVVGLSIAAIWLGRRRPYICTGWFWFFGMLLPVIGLIQWGSHSLADRFTYVPLIGFFIVLVWGAAEVWERWKLPKATGVGLVAILFLICAARTRDQLWLWRDSETLFLHALAVTENNEVALSNYGVCLAAAKKTDKAISYYRKALTLNPNSGETLGNLAVALTEKQQHDEAFACYRTAIELLPKKALLRLNYGNTLLDLDRVDEAIAQFQAAIQCEPDNPKAHNDLGRAYVAQRRHDEAIREYAAALDLNPAYAEAHNNWGLALAELGRAPEAIGHYRTAQRLDPNFIEIENNLGSALLAVGNMDEAIANFRSLLKLKPDHAKALDNLGIALAAKGQFAEAAECFRKALRFAPDTANTHYNLGNIFVMQRHLDEAAVEFRAAIRLDAKHAPAHCNLGNVLADLGRREEAIAELRAALRLKPDLAQAQARLHQLGE